MPDKATLARALVDQLPAMAAYWDADLRCRFANRDYERWFGVTPEWLIGKHISELLGPLYALNLPYIQGVLRGERQEFEREIPDPAGGPSRHSQAYYLPDVSEGVVRGFFVLVTDITRRVQAEQLVRERERQLQAAERVASMATLAAGLAHEINNPLSTVMVNLELLSQRLVDGTLDAPYARDLLSEARSDAGRIANIVHGMKLLARSDRTLDETFDVGGLIEQSVRLVWNDLRYRAHLVQDVQVVGAVRGSRTQLAQIIVALLRNAAESFSTADVERNEVTLRALRTDESIVVEVRDNGCGIAAKLQDTIFDPFFTTKSVGNAGLGLSISRSIAAAHSGELTVESRLGEGSTFRLRLPAAAQESPDAHAAASPSGAPRASWQPAQGHAVKSLILVIDDEPSVTKIMTRILSSDYEVTALTRPRDAVSLLLSSDVTFDLVLCDMMMPELSGADVYETVVRARPELRSAFVFMTGGAFTARTRQFLERTRAPVLDKPVHVEQVRAIARAHLSPRTV